MCWFDQKTTSVMKWASRTADDIQWTLRLLLSNIPYLWRRPASRIGTTVRWYWFLICNGVSNLWRGALEGWAWWWLGLVAALRTALRVAWSAVHATVRALLGC